MGDRNTTIDALRALAASSVMLSHFADAQQPGILFPFVGYGPLGVYIFFVISGFILPYAMWRAGYTLDQWHVFLAKRVLRLYPPYVVSIFFVLVITYAALAAPGYKGAPPDFTFTDFILHFGYLNGLLGHQWFQGVYWTLALEFQYYLLLCVAFPLLTARSQTTRFVSLAAGLLISLMFDVPRDNPPSLVFPFLSIFAAGTLAFWKTTGKINNALFLAGLVLDGICVAKIHGTPSLVATLATALAIAYVRFHGPWLVTSLGQMSYSLYLVHQIIGHRIINLFSRFGDDAFVTSASRWFAIALSFLLAYVLYRTVELPSQRLSQQIRYRSRSPQNVAVT